LHGASSIEANSFVPELYIISSRRQIRDNELSFNVDYTAGCAGLPLFRDDDGDFLCQRLAAVRID
jgi:hypothetical protein